MNDLYGDPTLRLEVGPINSCHGAIDESSEETRNSTFGNRLLSLCGGACDLGSLALP
jgi:hypothetical protein